MNVAHSRAGLQMLLSPRTVAWVGFAALAVAFAVSYGQYPLYYIAQNQYFFHGLVRVGDGLLKDDWVARTRDPWPAFTLLVELTHRWVGAQAFYLYFVVLLGVYLYSLVGIASVLFKITASKARFLAYLAVLVAVHSSFFGSVSALAFGANLRAVLIEGVASQRVLWDMFQPGAFGAFLLLSIRLFLRNKAFLAATTAAVAVLFNPTYLLTAGILTAAYLVDIVARERRVGRAVGLGMWTLVLVLPVVAYMVLAFRPTSPDLWARAQDILVHSRLARHADPAVWFDATAIFKMAVMLGGLYVLRGTPLFRVMAVAAAMAAGLTLVAIISRSNTLALLYPWRLSVLLVPLSTAVIIASVVTSALGSLEERRDPRLRMAVPVSIGAMVVLTAAGAAATVQHFRARPEIPVMRAVHQTKAAGDTYLIPSVFGQGQDPNGYRETTTHWQYFRLLTGAPVVVDYWFVPYNDVAVLEWYERVRAADAFYTAGRGDRCRMSPALFATYRVTHVILKRQDDGICDSWIPVTRDTRYTLYRVRSP